MTNKSTSVQFRDKVLAEIAKIEGMEAPKYKTACFHYPKNSRAMVDIKTAPIGMLTIVCAELLVLENANVFLGNSDTINGFPITDWLTDTKTRALQIVRNKKLAKLTALAKETEGILTGEEIKEIKFNSMLTQFNNL